MFFSNRIQSIQEGHRVLEIGPGGNPHPKADVFLELDFQGDEEEALAQRAYQQELNTEKEVVYYDGKFFPFAANEFDYVICAHVLEHVEDVEMFLNEMFRVAKRGFLEYPTIYYDYIYKIPEHLNLLLKTDQGLKWMKHEDIFLGDFDRIRESYYNTLFNNYWMKGFEKLFFQSYEWHEPFRIVKAKSLKEITYDPALVKEILPLKNPVSNSYHVHYPKSAIGLKGVLRKLHYKVGKMLA